uniref:ribosomal protein S9 n=1 Tax=Parallela transversalis TaxID=163324 RepID=UPI0010C2FABB|nr:ribosomal protein S9 [Parallela transversalis]AYQ22888.1 ribosomal protein S9 [Parallela transversalis]
MVPSEQKFLILAKAVGRRKEATATAQLIKGTGNIIINDKPAQDYLQNSAFSVLLIKAPFESTLALQSQQSQTDLASQGKLTGLEDNLPSFSLTDESFASQNRLAVDALIKVRGGGLIAQAQAVKLAIARALLEMEMTQAASSLPNSSLSSTTDFRKSLKSKGYLTCDSRVKERRKYGLKKARKASQYHKR